MRFIALDPKPPIIHDGWSSYRQYTSAAHGLCNAHRIRELIAVTDRDASQAWATELIELLREANRAAHHARDQGNTSLDPTFLAQWRTRCGDVIATGWAANPPPAPTGKRGRPKLGKTANLLRRLDEHRQDVLRFAENLAVSYTNNQAEHDLRIAKLQLKFSGCWRTTNGAATLQPSVVTSPPCAKTVPISWTPSPAYSAANPGYPPSATNQGT